MSALTDRIAAVVHEHAYCLGSKNTYDWAAHVAERIEAELGLREQRGGMGDSTYDHSQRRWVSAWSEVPR